MLTIRSGRSVTKVAILCDLKRRENVDLLLAYRGLTW
jgi:hypothetical protein